jgi:hypothetical protein
MSDTSGLTGRAIDVAVHRGLMGRECRFVGEDKDDMFGGAEFGPDREWHVNEWIDTATRLPIPFYSRDWAGAGLVVEEMARRGWDADVKIRPGTYYAEFSREARGGYECHYDAAPSVGVAVCRAALAAMEAAT